MAHIRLHPISRRVSGRDSRRSSLTLVEVMAALMIVGGAVTAALVALSGSLERIRTAHDQTLAMHVARELITSWHVEQTDVSIASSGTVPGREKWSWSRRSEELQITEDLLVSQITLELLRERESGDEGPVRSYTWFVKDEKL